MSSIAPPAYDTGVANSASGGDFMYWITDYMTYSDGTVITPTVASIVGLCLTSILWILASWRLFYHHLAQCSSCFQLRSDIFTTKRLQHGFLWTTMSVEIVGYANMVRTNSFNKLNYTVLGIVGMGILECNTFIIGTIHWFNIISRGRVEDKNLAFTIYPVLALVAVGLTASSTYEAVDLWKGGYDSVDGFRGKSEIYKITLLVEAIGWGIHSLVVTICGIIVYKRISSLPTISQVRIEARRRIITKMIVPMVFCALSYGLRSGFMAADFALLKLRPGATFEAGVGWWIGSCWVPTFIPSMMLLYSFRKRDNTTELIGAGSDPLLKRNGEEGISDPFQSFHQTNRDLEDEDSTRQDNE